MIASLPMYDLPFLRAETDRLWQAIAVHIPEAPAHLTRSADPWDDWQSPDLMLSQTCGLPYRARLHGQVHLVASPHWDLPDCPPGYYYSTLIRRRGDGRPLPDLCAGVLAINDPLSQSGWAAPVAHLAERGLAPARVMVTGAHLQSVAAVLDGRADYAAIDAVTLALWAAHHPDDRTRLDAFDRTAPTPALPYITAPGNDCAVLAKALAQGIAALHADDRAALRLRGVVQVPARNYLAVPIPAPPPGL